MMACLTLITFLPVSLRLLFFLASCFDRPRRRSASFLLNSLFLDPLAGRKGLSRFLGVAGLAVPASEAIVQCAVIVCRDDLVDLTNRIIEPLKVRIRVG